MMMLMQWCEATVAVVVTAKSPPSQSGLQPLVGQLLREVDWGVPRRQWCGIGAVVVERVVCVGFENIIF